MYKDCFFKYYWDEEEVLFYIHYRDSWPYRQIEISSKFTRFLSSTNPVEYESMLGDQPLDDDQLAKLTPISEDEFERIWEQNHD